MPGPRAAKGMMIRPSCASHRSGNDISRIEILYFATDVVLGADARNRDREGSTHADNVWDLKSEPPLRYRCPRRIPSESFSAIRERFHALRRR